MKETAQAAAFATSVRSFTHWVMKSKQRGAPAARYLLTTLLDLYRQALALPNANPTNKKEAPQLEAGEFKRAYRQGKRFPFNYYSEVFDPLTVPPQESVIGDLADDVADIYSDLLKGLAHHDAGQISDALWQWKLAQEIHWGEHATSAIRALHWWLVKNYQFGKTNLVDQGQPQSSRGKRKAITPRQKKVIKKPKFRG